MAHACGSYTVEGFLKGKSAAARALWDSLVDLVRTCGNFEFAPAKTRVAFMVWVRFMAVTSVSDRGITFHIWLRHRVDSPRFFRIDHPGSDAFIHWARVTSADQLDGELRELICASYLVGQGDA